MRGARKPTSRLVSASEPMNLVRISVAPGRKRSYVTQSDILDSHPKLRQDYFLLLTGMAFLEAVSVMTPFELQDETLFQLTEETLALFSNGQEGLAILIWALTKVLLNTGFGLHFNTCSDCGKVINSNPVWFAPSSGGAFCNEHFTQGKGGREVDGYALVGLEKVQEMNDPPKAVKKGVVCLTILSDAIAEISGGSLPYWQQLRDSLSR